MGTVRRSILLAVVAAALLPGTASAAAGGARTPLEAVHNYVAGVARLNAAEICRSFDPRLRLLVRRELGELPNVDSCAAAVASVLPFNRGHLWAGVRIERVNAVSLDRQSEIATVAVTLSRPARCAARGSSRSRCRARRASARDTIYALLSGGAWSIVKPGGLLRAAEVGGPLPRDPFYYAPPATPATVNRIAALAPAGFACPAALGAADPADDVRDEYRRRLSPLRGSTCVASASRRSGTTARASRSNWAPRRNRTRLTCCFSAPPVDLSRSTRSNSRSTASARPIC